MRYFHILPDPGSCPVCRLAFQPLLVTPDELPPGEGDVCLCTGCGALLLLDARWRPRRATREDLLDLDAAARADIEEEQRLIFGVRAPLGGHDRAPELKGESRWKRRKNS